MTDLSRTLAVWKLVLGAFGSIVGTLLFGVFAGALVAAAVAVAAAGVLVAAAAVLVAGGRVAVGALAAGALGVAAGTFGAPPHATSANTTQSKPKRQKQYFLSTGTPLL